MSINTEILLGTPVLNEDNTRELVLQLVPPWDFFNDVEQMTLRFKYMAAGHPDSGISESSFLITLYPPLGNPVYVDDDNTEGPWDGSTEHPYQYIQEGIDNASEFYTVYVCNGTYYENITINKSINLIGEDKANTIIDGNNSKVVVSIERDTKEVRISSFSIRNSSGFMSSGILTEYSNNIEIYNCNIYSNSWEGINIYHSNNTAVCNCTIYSTHFAGISMNQSGGNMIYNCNISNNAVGVLLSRGTNNTYIVGNIITDNVKGIFLEDSYNTSIAGNFVNSNDESGIHLLSYSRHNMIYWNNFTNNGNYGIYLQGNSNNNTIFVNTLSFNAYGACIKGSRNNTIVGNTIINNQKGLYLCCGAYSNRIYCNNLMQNCEWNAYDSYDNFWDNGDVGNYWDDYTGEDNNGNDIGDTPYDILGGNNQDFYPLMSPWISPSNTIYNDGFNEKKTCGFYLRSSEPSIIFDRMISIFPVFNRILNIN